MYVNSTDFQFDPPNMMEVAPIFAGEIFADKINDVYETLTYGSLIDSSMNGICRSADECGGSNGIASGNCASGFGVCCYNR